MATITEDYVSFETAKLLKEKGFNEGVNSYFISDNEIALISNRRDFNNHGIYLSAPTLQMAMKWLREEHNIAIEFWCCDYKWQADFATLPKGIDIYTSFENTVFDTYEEAVEAAIKYCLENLI